LIIQDTELINKQAIWYSLKAKKTAQQVGVVYESNESCLRHFEIRPNLVRTLNIDGYANYFDPLEFVFVVEFLPYRQLITADSPRSPYEKSYAFPSEIG